MQGVGEDASSHEQRCPRQASFRERGQPGPRKTNHRIDFRCPHLVHQSPPGSSPKPLPKPASSIFASMAASLRALSITLHLSVREWFPAIVSFTICLIAFFSSGSILLAEARGRLICLADASRGGWACAVASAP